MRSVRQRFGLFLLLALGSLSATLAHAQPCTLPAGYDHVAIQTEGSLEFTLATTQSSYLLGQPITMVLITRNIGVSSVTIPNPYFVTPIESFNMLPDYCDSLDQPNCLGTWAFWVPQALYYSGSPILITPGQCVQQSYAWSGTPEPGSSVSAGGYDIVAGYWEGDRDYDWEGPFRPYYNIYLPSGGIRLPIQIIGTSAVPPASPASWSRVKLRDF